MIEIYIKRQMENFFCQTLDQCRDTKKNSLNMTQYTFHPPQIALFQASNMMKKKIILVM